MFALSTDLIYSVGDGSRRQFRPQTGTAPDHVWVELLLAAGGIGHQLGMTKTRCERDRLAAGSLNYTSRLAVALYGKQWQMR